MLRACGDALFGEWTEIPEDVLDMAGVSGVCLVLSGCLECFPDLFITFIADRLFFCLNFSSHDTSLSFKWLSLLPTVVAKNRAFSLIMASETGMPCFCELRAQLDKVFSISGNFPLDRLTGDLAPSSGNKYFSFCRRTLETVLERKSVRLEKNHFYPF